MTRAFDAVSLDVGGVLVVPDHGALAGALTRAGVAHDANRFGIGHYLAMAAMDDARSGAEVFTDYVGGFAAAVGVADADLAAAQDVLLAVLFTPVWCQPVPRSRVGLRSLANAGLRLAVTSNSDGTVADHLRRHEWLQVGDGPGVPVEIVTDSGAIGVAKPDPRLFQATIDGLGLPPERILHIGDAVGYDVDGAAAVGMLSVHMDPFDVCRSKEHRHVHALADLLDLL